MTPDVRSGHEVPVLDADTEDRLTWSREMRRCEADVSYLAAEYLRIKSKTTIGFPTLRWNRVQQAIHAAAQAQVRRIGKIRQVWGKSRQVGSTTYWRARSFHQTALIPLKRFKPVFWALNLSAIWGFYRC